MDAQGNVYTTGTFTGTADFDPSGNSFMLVSAGLNDIFISKLDNTGNLVWAKKIGGNADDNGNSLALDAQGNVYSTGSFTNTVDFDPNAGIYNLISSGTTDIFITTLDNAGNFVWAKRMGGTDYDFAYAIALDSQGNVYTTGKFQGTADFDPSNGIYNYTSQGFGDIFISKLDNSCNFIWAKTIGGTDDDIGTSIALDTYGNVYTTGYFQNTVDFDPGVGTHNIISAGGYDIFISKLDASGNFFWANAIGGTGTDKGNANTIDAIGYVFTTGSFENTADFDPNNGIYNLSSVGGKDIFVHKMFKCITNNDTLTTTACDSITVNGQTYIVSGNYTQNLINATGCDSTLILNLTIHHVTDSTINQIACDTFTFNGQTYTSSGNYTYNFTNINGCDSTVYLNLIISNNDTLIESACQSYTLNGQTYTSSGIYTLIVPGCDSLITLILTVNSPTSSTITQTSCNSYTLNGQTYITSGVYLQNLTNVMGCDSLLTLNLTINNSTDSIITLSACDSFTLNGQTYSATGTYSQFFTNSVGCDSILTINLVINDTTYGTLTQNGCDSIVVNGQTYTTSGTYTQTLANAAGCDSILTLNLTILNHTNGTTNQTACTAYTINGQTFTTSGTYTLTLTNTVGCDSILTLNLSIYQTSTTEVTVFSCDSYTSTQGNTYYSSGVYEEYMSQGNGCYDTVTYILTIGYSEYYNDDDVEQCDSFLCNGIYYTQDGSCVESYINGSGCLTYISTYYTLYYSGSETNPITSCSPYHDFESGNTYYSDGTYYSYSIGTGPFGMCSYDYYIQLTIIWPPDTSITHNWATLTSNQTNATYQWYDCSNGSPISGATNQSFTPSQNGSYYVVVTLNGCTENSNCYTVLNAEVDHNLFSHQIQAYPNPTDGLLMIGLDTIYTEVEVKVFNLVGQILSTSKHEGKEMIQIEMPKESGVYFVTVKFKDGETVTVKVVRE